MRDHGLELLLKAAATAIECTSVQAWRPRQAALCARHANPVEAAIAGGFAADRLAWAFCSGYQAALRALVLVAARIGGAAQDERVQLKLALVRRDAPGVALRTMSEIRFIPEVAHAEVDFERVSISNCSHPQRPPVSGEFQIAVSPQLASRARTHRPFPVDGAGARA